MLLTVQLQQHGEIKWMILPSKSRFIVSKMVFYQGLRLEKEMGFSSFHKMIYCTDIVSNQISLVL